jgi:methionyl-tRNA formyltransferase
LLPEWRGADPITFAILSGQKETGVSLMLLTAGMDEGPILGYGLYDLTRNTTTPELTAGLIELSNSLLVALVPKYLSDEILPAPQNPAQEPTYSRKLTKADSIIDWSKPADVIEREIRAFIEWPKTRCFIGELEVIITNAHTIDLSGKAGSFVIHDKQLVAYCGSQALVIDSIKPAGKKEITGQAFLAGYKRYIT